MGDSTVLIVAIGWLTVFGCAPVPGVFVEAVRTRDLVATISTTECLVRPIRVAHITAGIGGPVERVAVREGERVAAGQLLAVVAGVWAETETRRHTAAVEHARARGERARSNVQVARRLLRLSTEQAARQERLWVGRHVSREAYDEAAAVVRLREAEVSARQTEADAAAHDLRANLADLNRARWLANREARVVAPFAGVVARLHVQEGQQVQAGEPYSIGDALLTLEDQAMLVVDAVVAESDVRALVAGQPAGVTFDAWPERAFPGRVAAVRYASAGQGLYRVEVEAVGAWDGVRPGFTCAAEITTANRRGALSVSKLALLARDGIDGVWVLRAGHVAFSPVMLGVSGAAHVEVLSGLRDGDEVVIGPFDVARDLIPGLKVQREP